MIRGEHAGYISAISILTATGVGCRAKNSNRTSSVTRACVRSSPRRYFVHLILSYLALGLSSLLTAHNHSLPAHSDRNSFAVYHYMEIFFFIWFFFQAFISRNNRIKPYETSILFEAVGGHVTIRTWCCIYQTDHRSSTILASKNLTL